MLNREDLQKILSAALSEQGIEVNSNQFEELLALFLEGKFNIDQTKQPITNQIERLAREFLFTSSAQAVWNDTCLDNAPPRIAKNQPNPRIEPQIYSHLMQNMPIIIVDLKDLSNR